MILFYLFLYNMSSSIFGNYSIIFIFGVGDQICMRWATRSFIATR